MTNHNEAPLRVGRLSDSGITKHVKLFMNEAAQNPSKLTHKQLLENAKLAYEQYMKANAVWQRCYDALINAKIVLEADPNNQSKLKQHKDALYDYESANSEWKTATDAMMTAKARFACASEIRKRGTVGRYYALRRLFTQTN